MFNVHQLHCYYSYIAYDLNEFDTIYCVFGSLWFTNTVLMALIFLLADLDNLGLQ